MRSKLILENTSRLYDPGILYFKYKNQLSFQSGLTSESCIFSSMAKTCMNILI